MSKDHTLYTYQGIEPFVAYEWGLANIDQASSL